MTHPADRPPTDLGTCARELEVGDWPGALALLSRLQPDGSEQWVRLAIVQFELALCLRCRARGVPEEAADHLRNATARLPAVIRVGAPGMCGHGVALGPAPAGSGLPLWTWQAGRVAWREQWELDESRSRFASDDRTAKHDQLTEACIDFLTRRDLCEYARQPGPATRGLDLTRGPRNLLALGNASRKFANPRAADLSDRVWKSFGGFPGLHIAALRRLAGMDLQPWTRMGGLAVDVPTRRGWSTAWHMARRCSD